MTDPEQRNLLTGWCEEGESIPQALDAVGADALQKTLDDLAAADTPQDEMRAAFYLQVLTQLQPVLRDTGGLQKAVDLELHASDGSIELAEVTSSLQNEFQRERSRMDRLTEAIGAAYSGTSSWSLHLKHGWSTPPTGKLLRTLARAVASELESFDAAGREKGSLNSADWMTAWHGEGTAAPGVAVRSASANVPEGSAEPYLDKLSRYLNTSDLIAGKREKLLRESEALLATRRHLYLLMASMGQDGGLLPTSPSYMTWGTFAAPDGLTDIWLDGGTGEIYHWTAENEWVFHRVSAN